MTIQKMQLSALRIAEVNVRRHTDKQITEYMRSLEMFGQVKPIVVDDTGEIICGNGLFLALQQMGATEADCYVMNGLTPNMKKKLMLADNRVYELGITDINVFEEIIHDLAGDVNVPGWDDELLKALNSTVDDVDDMVSSYGNFTADDTDRVNERRQTPMFAPPVAPASQISQLQQPLQTSTSEIYSATSLEAPPQEAPIPTQNGHYVICPHCGAQFICP